jgi:hypothetical protein
MSYVGYIKAMTDYCSHLKHPTVLEIGVDRGQTALPLYHNLLTLGRPFNYVGVDVRADDDFIASLKQMRGYCPMENSSKSDLAPQSDWNVGYLVINSLDFLPSAVAQAGWKFDLILIDGDHNYTTVKEELSFLDQISYPTSLVICDDYGGKHATVDTFYKDHPLHKDVKFHRDIPATPGKAGVKQAVDDWLEENPLWSSWSDSTYEPIILTPPGIERFTAGRPAGATEAHQTIYNFEFSSKAEHQGRLLDAAPTRSFMNFTINSPSGK